LCGTGQPTPVRRRALPQKELSPQSALTGSTDSTALFFASTRFLKSLPRPGHRLPADRMERVSLPSGHVLCRSGEALTHADFPVSGVVSSVIVLEGGGTVEASKRRSVYRVDHPAGQTPNRVRSGNDPAHSTPRSHWFESWVAARSRLWAW